MNRFRPKSKYGNVKVKVQGQVFDSKKEHKRSIELKELERGGLISDLRPQVRYQIIPKQPEFKERAAHYIADFVYVDTATGRTVIEDVKSNFTRKNPTYILKRKLMKQIYCGVSQQADFLEWIGAPKKKK